MTTANPWIERFRRLVLLPIRRRLSRVARISYRGRPFVVDTRDSIIGRCLYLGQDWEPWVSSLFPLLSLDGKVAVDAGANIGVHTIALSFATGEGGRVLAFEPESHALALLRRNIELNGVKNVTVKPVALGNRRGRARLALSASNLGDHRILTEDESSSEELEEVQIETLDESCLPLGPNAVALIKIDVQGYEGHVLRGAEATLDANPDVWLILEIPEAGSRQLTQSKTLVRWLVDRGFHGVELRTNRVIPMLDPDEYSMILDDDLHLLLSRNEIRLKDVVRDYRSAQRMSRGL